MIRPLAAPEPNVDDRSAHWPHWLKLRNQQVLRDRGVGLWGGPQETDVSRA